MKANRGTLWQSVIGVVMTTIAVLQDGRLTAPYVVMLVLGVLLLAVTAFQFAWRNSVNTSRMHQLLLSVAIGALPLIGLLRIFAK